MSTVETPETSVLTSVLLDSPWQVVIHDDPVNLMSYVVHVIRKVFGYSPEECRRIMLQVHQEGKSVAWVGAKEQAEHYVRELHSFQLLATLSQVE